MAKKLNWLPKTPTFITVINQMCLFLLDNE